MIDFSKIAALIPEGGRLVLTFSTKAGTKENGDTGTKELAVVFAQQFTGKENDSDFSPLIITGTIAELTESFETTITDIGRDQTTLAALKATATTTKVSQKKKQLAEAIQKHTKDQKKNPEEEKKVEAREEKPKPSMTDLFSMSPAKADVQPAAQTETFEETGEVHHG
ncbi:MAG: hypothetical protein ABSC55_28395 [Syntrophorhabdales bacterium]|jgi:lipid II:glycine glycyltransferase (peptidoglycan interpeptide bridge formation enzyme)